MPLLRFLRSCQPLPSYSTLNFRLIRSLADPAYTSSIFVHGPLHSYCLIFLPASPGISLGFLWFFTENAVYSLNKLKTVPFHTSIHGYLLFLKMRTVVRVCNECYRPCCQHSLMAAILDLCKLSKQ